ncbi:MAG TPA: alanine dehydrogenase [Anaerolineae bacterium]|nr:alanine dehydrogenase [Anaerolineae bacterium]
MDIGVPRERRANEYRVGLTPAGVELLTHAGHACYVETDAGRGAGFSDVDYQRAGARTVYSMQEAYGRADLVLKVGRPTDEEVEALREGSILMGFLHLAAGRSERVEGLLEKRVTAIAFETIETDDGRLPVLAPLSQAAGRMAPQIAGTLLQNDRGGKGILLAGVPGVPPAEVVIIGAGTFGTAAARAFLGLGASVYVLDRDLANLQRIDDIREAGGRAITMVSHPFNVRKVARFADVLIGAVLVPGARAPIVVTREMVRSMKPRSLIMDISIDQGGCVETSRPTTHRDPTFVDENVIHYCVPNMTAVVARTATHAFNNAAWPYIQEVARSGLEAALASLPALARGVATREGRIIHEALAASLNMREKAL